MKRRFFVTGLCGLATLPLVGCGATISDKTLGRVKSLSAKVTEAAVRWGTGVAPELVSQISDNNAAIQALEPGASWLEVGKVAIRNLVVAASLLIPLLPIPSPVSALLSTVVAAINGILPVLAGAASVGVYAGVASLEDGEKAAKELNLYVVGVRRLNH